MGWLAEMGAKIGAAGAPGSATQAAQQSMGWGTLATGLDVAGNVLSGVGAMQQANYMAKLAGINAGQTRLAGQYEESAQKMRTTAAVASQKAQAAASGIQVDSGSAEAVRASTQAIGDMDAAMIHYNSALRAYGFEAQGAMDKAAGRGAFTGSLLKAGGSFLSGAKSLSDKWSTYKRSGAL